MSELKVKYVRLDKIVSADKNPKKHDLEAIKGSIRKFGFNAPILRNDVTGRLVAGHGRTEALTQLLRDGSDVPERIKTDKDGMWMVPVLDVPFTSENVSNQYLLADNRLSEIGGWDSAGLAEMLEELHNNSTALGLGWSEAEIEGIIAANQKIVREVEERDEDEGSTDLLEDLRGGSEIREIVLHLSADEYDLFVGRLQRVMATRRLPGYVEAVSALLDHWEAEAD